VETPIPEGLHRLFWDVDPRGIELPRHADYVIERVMLRGDWGAMVWLRRTFPREVLADFLQRKADRLPARERAYWHLIATSARQASAPGGGRPSWAGT
jgi:hypothetical protein